MRLILVYFFEVQSISFMKLQNSKLVLRQLDNKIRALLPLRDIQPATGWVSLIRKTLNMSLQQLGNKMSITAQGIQNVEKREKGGTITLQTLKATAEALDMILVYGFIPKDGSLEKLIERKAYEKAQEIVSRTSTTMKLEDQGNSDKRIKQAVEELAEEIKREMPKGLWNSKIVDSLVITFSPPCAAPAGSRRSGPGQRASCPPATVPAARHIAPHSGSKPR